MQSIRIASQTDLPRIVAIHNQAIISGRANAYLQPFSVENYAKAVFGLD